MKVCCPYPILKRNSAICISCGNRFYDASQVISSLLSFPEKITKFSYLNTYGVWEVQGLWEFDIPNTYLGNLDVIAKLLAPKSYQGLTFKKVESRKIDFIVPYELSTEIETVAVNESITISFHLDFERLGLSQSESFSYIVKAIENRPGVTVEPGDFPDTVNLIYSKKK